MKVLTPAPICLSSVRVDLQRTSACLSKVTGSRLHAAHVLAGLSREEVADRAGLCRHSIRKWE
jgi:DNA-binding XRE family transcriptional regulator